jgi:hypothetical protein
LRVGVLAVACALGYGGAAEAAENETEALHVHFERDEALAPSCPGAPRFLELLRAQRPRLILAPEAAPARTFDVHIRKEGSEIGGELTIIELDGTRSVRAVQAPSCTALVSALAVVAAIAMDEPPPAPAHEEPPEPAPSSKEPLVKRPIGPIAVPVAVGKPSPTPARPTRRLAAGFGLGSELVLGALPRATTGYRGYAELERPLHDFMIGARLSFAFARAPLPDTQKLDIFVQIWTARLEACGGHDLIRNVSFEGCLGPTLGAYHSYSTHVLNARDDVRPWFTLDAGARLRWHPAGSAFFAEAYAYASYVTTAYNTVARDGSAASHEVPRGIGEIGIGLGRSCDLP